MEDSSDWIEYRQLVLQQLKETKSSIDKITDSLDAQKEDMSIIKQRLDSCNLGCSKTLFGNGSPEKGLVVRTDRIEQKIGLQSKILFILIPLFFGAVIDYIFKR